MLASRGGTPRSATLLLLLQDVDVIVEAEFGRIGIHEMEVQFVGAARLQAFQDVPRKPTLAAIRNGSTDLSWRRISSKAP